jgi:PAS domain S-box-containing protein
MPGGRNRLAAKVVTADLKRAESAVRESEARFRATFEIAAIGMAHVALDGRWLRVNQRFCEITGYTREQLLSRTFAEVTHPDDIEADWKLKRALISGEIATCSFEERYLRKDGTAIWVKMGASRSAPRRSAIFRRRKASNQLSPISTLNTMRRTPPSLFRVFRRIHPGSPSGRGIGLAIAKRIVQRATAATYG